MVYAIIAFIMISVISGPALQSMMSKRVEANKQGELQGSLFSIMSITTIIAPLIYTKLFSTFTEKSHYNFPGAPYIGATLFSLIGLFLIFNRRKSL